MIVKAINFHGQQLSKILEEKHLKLLGGINIRDVDYHTYQQRAKDLRYVTRVPCVWGGGASFIHLHQCSYECKGLYDVIFIE